jgi:hypothetical protein
MKGAHFPKKVSFLRFTHSPSGAPPQRFDSLAYLFLMFKTQLAYESDLLSVISDL